MTFEVTPSVGALFSVARSVVPGIEARCVTSRCQCCYVLDPACRSSATLRTTNGRTNADRRSTAKQSADAGPALRISQGLARVRSDCRPDNGGSRCSEGNGLRHDRRPPCAGWPLHGAGAHGDLRRGRDVPASEREHDHDTSHPNGVPTRAGCPGGRVGVSDQHLGDADSPGGSNSVGGFAASVRLHRQLHLGTGARWLQDGDRAGHLVGSDPQAAWRPRSQERFRPYSRCNGAVHPSRIAADADRGNRNDRAADRDRALSAASAGAADRGSRRDRQREPAWTAGARRRAGRSSS